MRGFAALTLSIVAIGLLPAVPAAAADTSPPQLVDIQLSSSSFTVTGFAYAAIQLRLHLTDDTGVVRADPSMGADGTPFVRLTKTAAGRGQVQSLSSDVFTLTSGTAQDGWWSTTLRMTAGYDGAWTVTEVNATDASGNHLDVDPRTQGITKTMQVKGEDIPHLSMRQTPDPSVGLDHTLTFYCHVTDLDTGMPLRASVHMGFDAGCTTFPYGGASSVTSGLDGSWQLSFPPKAWSPDTGCASIYNLSHVPDPNHPGSTMAVQIFYVDLHIAPHYLWPISATMSRTPIKLGETATVSGSTGAIGEMVHLERLYKGSWLVVGSAKVRTSGRFTLIAQPPSIGNWRYRVQLFRTVPGEQTSTSRIMLLGVTS